MWSKNVTFQDGQLHLSGISAKQLAKDFGTPAFVIDEDDFRTRAKSWSDAVAHSSGYQSKKTIDSLISSDPINPANLSSHFFIGNRLQQIASAFLEGVASSNKNTIRVIDVGGGLGQYFFLLEKLAPSIQFEWVILETTALCELAKSVAPTKKNIGWISSLADTQGTFDIALLSSVIQYVESPFDLLDDLMKVAKFLIVNRLPLTSSRNPKICIQRPGFFESKGSYPVNILSEDEITKQREYNIVDPHTPKLSAPIVKETEDGDDK